MSQTTPNEGWAETNWWLRECLIEWVLGFMNMLQQNCLSYTIYNWISCDIFITSLFNITLHDFIASSADDSFFMNGRCIKVGCVGVHFVEFSERPQGSWILSRRTWYSSHKFALRAKLVPVIMCEKSKSTTFSYYKMILIREGRSIYHLKHQAAKSVQNLWRSGITYALVTLDIYTY